MTLSMEYIAGLFDGEGCITIRQHTKRDGRVQHYISLNITNIYKPLLESLKELFGGVVRIKPKSQLGNLQVYTWELNGIMCSEFINSIITHSIIKQEQLQVGLDFIATMSNTRSKLPTHVLAQREQLYNQSRDLKHKEYH